jgi:TPR repeat protein
LELKFIGYSQGYGVEKSEKESFHWFKKSADQNLSLSQVYLGLSYKFGKGVEKNYDLMIQYFQKSSQQNDPIGNYQLGICSFYFIYSL